MMSRISLPTGSVPTVVLRVDGNLTLKGGADLEITVKSDNGAEPVPELHGDEVSIRCAGSCTVRVPVDARVRIERVGGHATIKSLDGELHIQSVSGHLNLKNVGSARLDRISGHLNARNIGGDLVVGTVDGNASVKDIEGDFTVSGAINGNLSLNDVDGNATARANGSINLTLDPTPGSSYQFETSGSLYCRIPADASLEVDIPRAASLSIRIPDILLPDPLRAPCHFSLADREASLTLAASGALNLAAMPSDWGLEDLDIESGADVGGVAESISQQVNQQIEAQMEMLEQQIEAQLARLPALLNTAALSPQERERINQRAQETQQRAAARAQEKIQRAQERLERKLEAARRRAEMKARAAERAARDRRRRPEPYDFSPPSPEPPSQPVSDAERLMILQMVEQKQITIEEAEQLLAALEGTE